MSLTLLIFLFWFFGLLSALRVLEGKGYATMSGGGEGVLKKLNLCRCTRKSVGVGGL